MILLECFLNSLKASWLINLYTLCLAFVMLLRLLIAALWSPAGKGLTSWLLIVMSNYDYVAFHCGFLGQVWYFVLY